MRRLRRKEVGPSHKTEKPDLDVLSPPPFLGKQLVQRTFLPQTAALPLSAPAFSGADPDCNACPTTAAVQLFSLLEERNYIPPHIHFKFIFLLPASFLKGFEISDKNMNGTAR